ncbi:MAG: hypothetical protein DLM67_02120 [Candidatus Nephthysia bennettiae]|nr:MAG: hypothetical protein DLM67_02120 [Candidatus Dormibacteraeota bacterium]
MMPVFGLIAVMACGLAELATLEGRLLGVSGQTAVRIGVALGLVRAAAALWFRARSRLALTSASAIVVVATGLFPR